jgi:hypothetical protein
VSYRINLGRLGDILLINIGETGQGIDTVNVHGARTTNPFAARATKGEGGILFILNLNESIQHHGPAVVKINRIRAEVGLLVLLWIPTVDFKVLDTFLLVDGRCGDLE